MREVGKFLHTHTKVKGWIPTRADQLSVLQWDYVDEKVHLEQGFFTRQKRVPQFYWDFDTTFW